MNRDTLPIFCSKSSYYLDMVRRAAESFRRAIWAVSIGSSTRTKLTLMLEAHVLDERFLLVPHHLRWANSARVGVYYQNTSLHFSTSLRLYGNRTGKTTHDTSFSWFQSYSTINISRPDGYQQCCSHETGNIIRRAKTGQQNNSSWEERRCFANPDIEFY